MTASANEGSNGTSIRLLSTLIVGAGPAGLAAGAEMMRSGCSVTILEKDRQTVGGLSRTVQFKGFRFDIGGHRFFSKNPGIVLWWKQRLGNDFISVKRRSRILYRGRLYDYPLQPINALRNLGAFMATKCVLSYLWARLFPTHDEDSFDVWMSNRFGRLLFNTFFKTYTEKVWGISCDRISADWARQRIKGMSLKAAIFSAFKAKTENTTIKTLAHEFYYPRLGPGMLWEKVRDDLLRKGAHIQMGRDVIEIERSKNQIIRVRTRMRSGQEEYWPADQFILSMPLQETVLKMRPRLPDVVESAANNLKYRDFITVALIVEREHVFPDQWIYVHDPEVKLGRIQNFKNWSPAMVSDSKITCLGLEYFCNVGDELWSLSDEQLLSLAKSELARIGLAQEDEIRDGRVVRVEKAYPVYDSEYRANVSTIRKELGKFSNLQVAGRNGMHKYNNQDHSMMTGFLSARNVQGEKYDLWRVNTDAEYLENEGEASDKLMPHTINSH